MEAIVPIFEIYPTAAMATPKFDDRALENQDYDVSMHEFMTNVHKNSDTANSNERELTRKQIQS